MGIHAVSEIVSISIKSYKVRKGLDNITQKIYVQWRTC